MVSNLVSETFTAVQYNRTCHQNFLKKLRKYHDTIPFENFVKEFISHLVVPLSVMERHPHVENTLQFAAKFVTSFQPENTDPDKANESEDETEEEMCPFLQCIFDFLLTHHAAREVSIRYRMCYFLNMVLDNMGDNAMIDDTLWNRIMSCMMERILDRSPKVRAQAAIALYRLQDPRDMSCPVINVYLFHLAKDPSPEVRRVILAKIGKNKYVLLAALKRTRDIDESVRKMAYLFISKITAKSLTISQREHLIGHGLKDRSASVLKCIREVLLPAWLRYYDNIYIDLIKALDPENSTETVTQMLKCMFKNADIETLINQTPIDKSTRLIPLDQLSSENILYWRCLVEHLQQNAMSDEFEQIISELTPFCTYIKEYVTMIKAKNAKNQWELVSNLYILHQLLEMVKMHDLSDEVGRKNLKEIMLEILLSDFCSDNVTKCIVQYFEKVVLDVNERVSALVEVINELRMPTRHCEVPTVISDEERKEKNMKKAKLAINLLELEDEEYEAIQNKDYIKAQEIQTKITALRKEVVSLTAEPTEIPNTESAIVERDDPETIIECLRIMVYMMQSPTVNILTPTLRTLMENIALPCTAIQNPSEEIRSMALMAIGLCCHMDKDLAKRKFMVFLAQFSTSENESLWIVALKTMFDLLLKHGLKHFDISEEDNDVSTIHDSSKRTRSVRLYSQTEFEDINLDKDMDATDGSYNIIKIIMGLLDSPNQELQCVATEGLCKLLLHKRISSSHLLSRLLILWHNPTSKDNSFLSQCLCNFFNYYVIKVPESQTMLEEAYLPTLRVLANAPGTSPLQCIDPLRVSEVILNLTCYRVQKTYSIHNNLTFTILNEVLNRDTEIDLGVLIKSLKFLDVQFETPLLKDNIEEALNKVEDLLQELEEKRLLNSVLKFRVKLTITEAERESSQIESQDEGNKEANTEDNIEDKDEREEIEDDDPEDEEMESEHDDEDEEMHPRLSTSSRR